MEIVGLSYFWSLWAYALNFLGSVGMPISPWDSGYPLIASCLICRYHDRFRSRQKRILRFGMWHGRCGVVGGSGRHDSGCSSGDRSRKVSRKPCQSQVIEPLRVGQEELKQALKQKQQTLLTQKAEHPSLQHFHYHEKLSLVHAII